VAVLDIKGNFNYKRKFPQGGRGQNLECFKTSGKNSKKWVRIFLPKTPEVLYLKQW
jgi:hypothetical protein